MNEKRSLTGYAVINDSSLNKSTAFSRDEREKLGLRGLLPYVDSSQERQMTRALQNMRRKKATLRNTFFYLLCKGVMNGFTIAPSLRISKK